MVMSKKACDICFYPLTFKKMHYLLTINVLLPYYRIEEVIFHKLK